MHELRPSVVATADRIARTTLIIRPHISFFPVLISNLFLVEQKNRPKLNLLKEEIKEYGLIIVKINLGTNRIIEKTLNTCIYYFKCLHLCKFILTFAEKRT